MVRPRTRCHLIWLPAVVLLGVGFGLAPDSAAQESGGEFTRAERRRLIAGELVRRPVSRREGGYNYIGGTSWQRVRAPVDEVWAVVNDVSQYPHLIPGVERARQVHARDGDRLLFISHRYSFVTASYFTHARPDAASHTIRFELDRSRPHDVRAGHGFLSVDRFRRNESIVSWGVMADVGSGILTGVFAPIVHDWILKVPFCVRGRVEPGHPGC